MRPVEDVGLAVRRCVARTFGVPLDEVPPDLALGGIAEWDSVGHVDLLVTLNEMLGVDIDLASFARLVSIPAITAHLIAHNGDRG